MIHNQDEIDIQLRDLLSEGKSLGDALRVLHGTRGIGLMSLWPTVMAVTGQAKEEAMKTVLQETWESRQQRKQVE